MARIARSSVSGGSTIVVRGLDDMRRALAEVSAEAPKAMRKELREAAKIVQAEARRRAPRGGRGDPHPGRLARSIKVSVRGASAFVRATAVAPTPANPYSHARRGSLAGVRRRHYPIPYPYPLRVEYEGGGRSGRGAEPGPRAFLFPALDASRDAVMKRLEEGIRRVIDTDWRNA